MRKLVIVESPAKAKTISKILGPDFVVEASVGHVRDLPQHTIGVAISADQKQFTPDYIVQPEKQKKVDELIRAAANADEIFLASDPDREGESISWHLYEILSGALARKGLEKPFHRVEYHEITPGAVREAFAHPHAINMNRVDAQQARRLIDRFLGYKISPHLKYADLGSRNTRALSVGRVQSVALRIVCEREKKVLAFVPAPYWEFPVSVQRQTAPLTPFTIRLKNYKGKNADRITDKAAAEAVEKMLSGASYTVSGITEGKKPRRPKPPFTTSALQQAAHNQLNMTTDRTLRLAQSLYEQGFITYTRTDSVAISKDASEACEAFIRTRYGADFTDPHGYRNREGAQAAHEAIRPTDPNRLPAEISSAIQSRSRPEDLRDAVRLYELIWRRFIESQMKPAVYNTVSAEVRAENAGATALLSASTSQLVFPGFLAVRGQSADSENEAEPAEKDDATSDRQPSLPPLAPGDALSLLKVLPECKETKPPARFNEASLVRELEENGIGRPSTYASVISTLKNREYVQTEKRVLVPTEIGMRLVEYLVPRYPEMMDIGYTAKMESQLDEIEDPENALSWQELLSDFYPKLLAWIDEAKAPPAENDHVKTLLNAFKKVINWAAPRTIGKRVYSDRAFVQDIANQFTGVKKPSKRGKKAGAEPEAAFSFDDTLPVVKSVSRNQLLHLARTLLAYADQIPEAEEIIRSVGLEDVIHARTNTAPPAEMLRIFDILDAVPLEEHEVNFYHSLASQARSGKRLTENQMRALGKIFVRHHRQIPGFSPELCAGLGLEYSEPFDCDPQRIREELSALSAVTAWREPATEGKRRAFNEKEFYESLAKQFESRGALSLAQCNALDNLLLSYKEQIPQGEELISRYGIEAHNRQPRKASGSRRFSRASKKTSDSKSK